MRGTDRVKVVVDLRPKRSPPQTSLYGRIVIHTCTNYVALAHEPEVPIDELPLCFDSHLQASNQFSDVLQRMAAFRDQGHICSTSKHWEACVGSVLVESVEISPSFSTRCMQNLLAIEKANPVCHLLEGSN